MSIKTTNTISGCVNVVHDETGADFWVDYTVKEYPDGTMRAENVDQPEDCPDDVWADIWEDAEAAAVQDAQETLGKCLPWPGSTPPPSSPPRKHNHQAGPWKIEAIPESGSLRRIIDKSGGYITTACHCSNARLIAAAPELLEALKAIMPLCDRDDVRDTWAAEFDAAEKAVSKATED